MRVEVVVGGRAAEFGGEFAAGDFEVDGFCEFAGALGGRLAIAEHDALHLDWPAAIGLAEAAREHVDHAFREVD